MYAERHSYALETVSARRLPERFILIPSDIDMRICTDNNFLIEVHPALSAPEWMILRASLVDRSQSTTLGEFSLFSSGTSVGPVK